MSTLFFEGFNIINTNREMYLDSKYWSKQFSSDPKILALFNTESTTSSDNFLYQPTASSPTYGYIGLSGAKTFTNPPESQTYIQLSGVQGLPTSTGLYIGMRVLGLNYDPSKPFPHAQKLISFCSGMNEHFVVEAICVTGESAYGSSWNSDHSLSTGIGLRIVQDNSNIAIYDLRIPDIVDLEIRHPIINTAMNPDVAESLIPNFSFGIVSRSSPFRAQTRSLHLEFYIETTGLELKVEGIETKNSYNDSIGVQTIVSGTVDNIKFYNRNVTSDMIAWPQQVGSNQNISYGRGECAGLMCYDDITIVSEDSVSPNYWVGETCRIIPLVFSNYNLYGWPNQDRRQNLGWTEFPGNPDNPYTFPASALDSRDGDNTIISASTSGNIFSIKPVRTTTLTENLLFGINYTFLQKDIGGIRLFNEVRKLYLNSSFVNVYGTNNGETLEDYYEIGDIYNVSNNNYKILSSFSMNNPVSNNPWTSGDIFGPNFGPQGIFGVKKL